MDYFLDNLYYVCKSILPLLGICVLVVLFIALIKIIKLLTTLNTTIQKAHPSIDLVEKTLDKVQAPVDTVVKVSRGLDKAYDVSAKTIEQAKDLVIKNATILKDKVTSLVKQENNNDIDIDDYREEE